LNIGKRDLATFELPFIRFGGQEVAFYPKVDSRDISKIHILPSDFNFDEPNDI